MDDRIGVGTGWSNDPDPKVAGAHAAAAALEQCGSDPNVAFVFATVDYDPAALLAGVREKLGITPIHGGTSHTGIITPGGFICGEHGAVGIMVLATPYIEFATGYAEMGDDPMAAGRAAIEMAMKLPEVPGGLPEAVFLTATPGCEEAVIRGIAQVLGEDVPVIGGSAADNTVESKWHVFANDKVMGSGVVATILYTHLPTSLAFGSGYVDSGKKAVATKAAGRTLFELDGRPAVDVYAEWTGKDPKTLAGMNLLGASVSAPVAVRDSQANFSLVKHPAIAGADGSIQLFADVRQDDQIELVEASKDELLDAVCSTIQQAMDAENLEKEDVATLLLVHCGGRRGALGDRIAEVSDCIKRTAGDVPFISYLTFGEQGCLSSGRNVHGDLLLSVLVIGK